jgi:hypothetical protein
MSNEVITKTEIETGTGTEAKIKIKNIKTKIKKTNQAITTTATTTSATSTLQQNHESDRINKSKFEAATSGLLSYHANPHQVPFQLLYLLSWNYLLPQLQRYY